MRCRASGAVLILSGTLVLAAAVPPVVATDSAPTGGRAASSGTLLELAVGGTTITFGTDASTTRRARDATALMIVGSTGDTEIGRIAAERTNSGTRRTTLGPGTLNLGGAGVFNVADSEVVATLEDDERAVSRVVTSVVGSSLASVADAGVVTQEVNTFSGPVRSRSLRTVEVADLTILTLDQLLDALNLGLLTLPCDSVESVSATLGAPPTDACDELNGILAQIAAAVAILESAEVDATALRDATQPLRDAQQTIVDTATTSVASLTTQRDALLAQAAGLDRGDLETTLADLQAEIAVIEPLCTIQGLLCSTLASLNAQAATVTDQLATLDELDAAEAALTTATNQLTVAQAALDALDATLAQALSILDALTLVDVGGQPTCDDASNALTQAGALVPSLAAAATAVQGALDAACADLFDELDALLDTPLLRIGGVEVTMDARTEDSDAASIVDGTIGSISIGALPPTAQDLEIDDAPALESAANQVGAALDSVLSTLGFAGPALEIELLRTTRTSDVDADGSARATAGLALVDVRAPATATALPATSPFGPLADLLPDASGPNGNVTLPAFRFIAGSFSAASSFPVAAVGGPPPGGGGGGGGGGGLPLTGVAHRFDLAALLFLAAVVVRRFAAARAS